MTDEELLALHRETTNAISKFNNAQMAKKICINSLYGAVANKFFRYFSFDGASAITVSGQFGARWVEKDLNEFLNKYFRTNGIDYVIAIDTDSVYLKLETEAHKYPAQERVDAMAKFAKEVIQPVIDGSFARLAVYMNAYANEMDMKREAICEKAIWRKKKHYILQVWDNEGIRYKEAKLKMKGIETNRSSVPKICRDALKEAIRLIMTTDEKTVLKYISEFKAVYKNTPFEDIAAPSGINGLDVYSNSSSIYSKGSPVHVKGALLYNHQIRTLKLENKYKLITDKDKIKYAYLKLPNTLMDKVISVPRTIPKEFDLDKYIDYDLMFDKTFFTPISSILKVIGWKNKKVRTVDKLFGL